LFFFKPLFKAFSPNISLIFLKKEKREKKRNERRENKNDRITFKKCAKKKLSKSEFLMRPRSEKKKKN